MRFRKNIIVAAAIGTAVALAIPAADAAVTGAPTPGTVWGCLLPNRTLANIYTTSSGFVNFLNANGGQCPSGSALGIGYQPPASPSPSPSPSTTTATPTPSATTTTPTPTPTPTSTQAAYTCVNSTTQCPVSGSYSDGIPAAWTQQGVVEDNVGPVPALSASGLGNWQAVTSVPASNGCSVYQYPAAQANTYPTVNGVWHPIDWSAYNTFTVAYAHTDPANRAGCDEWAFDFWMQAPTANAWTGTSQEVMVWTDNNGASPAGSATGATWTDPTYGDVYDIWSGFSGNTISLVRHGNATSGHVDLKALFTFLHANYGIATGIEQVNYGNEIRNTNGQSETFKVTNLVYSTS